MWTDENDDIEKIYKDFDNIKKFPAKCPICEQDAAHLYIHIYDNKTKKGGLWIWCSHCHSFSHGSIQAPVFWDNCSLVELEKLSAVPTYLEEIKESIDTHANQIKQDHK